MKKTYKLLGTALLAGAVMVGCSSNEDETPKVDEVEDVENGDNEVSELPVLTADLVQDGDVLTLTWEVENMVVSEENYGSDHVDGEGHAHIYINGEKTHGLKNTDPVVIEDLEPGTHEIKISLQMNDHEYYDVVETFEVTVGEPAEEDASEVTEEDGE